MQTSAEEEDIKMEIQKTLLSINDTFVEIKKELKAVNELVKQTGELHTAVLSANEKLCKVAEQMGIDSTVITSVDPELLQISADPIKTAEQLLNTATALNN